MVFFCVLVYQPPHLPDRRSGESEELRQRLQHLEQQHAADMAALQHLQMLYHYAKSESMLLSRGIPLMRDAGAGDGAVGAHQLKAPQELLALMMEQLPVGAEAAVPWGEAASAAVDARLQPLSWARHYAPHYGGMLDFLRAHPALVCVRPDGRAFRVAGAAGEPHHPPLHQPPAQQPLLQFGALPASGSLSPSDPLAEGGPSSADRVVSMGSSGTAPAHVHAPPQPQQQQQQQRGAEWLQSLRGGAAPAQQQQQHAAPGQGGSGGGLQPLNVGLAPTHSVPMASQMHGYGMPASMAVPHMPYGNMPGQGYVVTPMGPHAPPTPMASVGSQQHHYNHQQRAQGPPPGFQQTFSGDGGAAAGRGRHSQQHARGRDAKGL